MRACWRVALLLIAFALLSIAPAHAADCTDPNRPEGTVIYNANYNVPQYCNGSVWMAFGALNPAAGGGNCADPLRAEGTILYNSSFKILQYCDGTNWRGVGGGGVSGGGAFLGFTELTNQPTSTQITSNILQVQVSGSQSISISGDGSPSYRICADPACSVENHTWTSAAGSIDDGEFVQLRLTTGGALSTTYTAALAVGGSSTQWVVAVTMDPTKWVFISSTIYDGALGGITGADNKCQARASAAGLPGTYRAWISTTSGNDPASLWTHLPPEFEYTLVGGTKIADGWADLTDGSLDAVIDKDEFGNAPGTRPWSGTADNGTATGSNNCGNWASNNNLTNGSVASTTATTNWSAPSTVACNLSRRVLCFQQ